MNSHGILPQKGNYKSLKVYQKAESIYDITYYFAHTFLSKGDRTIDQMIQAARSGKQNIVEGSAAGTTSTETDIKLKNVAKASLQELLIDYEDFLRVRGLEQWSTGSEKYEQARRVCAIHNDSLYYRQAIVQRSAETIANIAIILIHQTDYMLYRLIRSVESRFLQEGGIKEKLSKARIEYRKNNQ